MINNKKIFIAGQEGMVGKAIYDLLKSKNLNVIDCKRKNLDLTSQIQVNNWFKKFKPNIVINAAGKVGGILDNSLHKIDYIYINTMIGFNLVNASLSYKVKKFINLGSACIYPKDNKQPIKEEYLLSSFLEKSNEGYAIAKIGVLKYCEYINFFLKKDFISLQPTNLYGERDNFNLKSSHVIPALIRKFHDSKIKKKTFVEVWGSGSPKREFMHVTDLADAVYFCLNKKISHSFMNVGSGDYISIRELSKLIKKVTNYEGKIYFNKNYPDGVLERKLDVSRINKMGWHSKINLEQGLRDYYSYFKKLNLK
jgi:GDP-L-fucose synthase